MMKTWVRPKRLDISGEVHKEYRAYLATLEPEIQKYLPDANELSTTKKDVRNAEKQLALRVTAPLSTYSNIFGMFATPNSRFFATASKDQLIQRYKQDAQNDWVKNQAEVLDDIKLSGRHWLPGNN